MSIGEVARKMGLRSSAIRYYEKLGLIPKAPRLSGRRRYDERALERLAMVRFAKHVGFSIAEIKVLLRGVDGRPPPERWRKLAAEKVAQVYVRQPTHQSRARNVVHRRLLAWRHSDANDDDGFILEFDHGIGRAGLRARGAVRRR